MRTGEASELPAAQARWLALPGLVDMVRRSSEEALQAGGYSLRKQEAPASSPGRGAVQVRLPQ